jgi:lipid-binding SYLF domain-containing protein
MKGLALFLGVCASSVPLLAENANERLKDATEVFQEIMGTPEKGIPQELLENAHCVVIVPGVKEVAFGIGGKYGRGFAVCRKTTGAGWGAPAAVRVEGGSLGFQIGANSTDLVMLVMNQRGMKRLLEDKFTIGADATAAAGPVGRDASARTDAQLGAEILSYSRSKGLFAGVSLEGSTLRNDLDENKELYGRTYHNNEILMQSVQPPASANELLTMLNRYSRHEEGVVKAKEKK